MSNFGKGESMVKHYRYKVKISAKWKVRSIDIPVGKLPKVTEAIASPFRSSCDSYRDTW
jgi:hypothetical protein